MCQRCREALLRVYTIIFRRFFAICTVIFLKWTQLFKRITNRAKKIHNSTCRRCRKALLKVYTINFRCFFLIYAVLFLIGRYLAISEDFPFSLVHQINLSIISMLGLYMLQRLHAVTTKLRDDIVGVNVYISTPMKKLNDARMSPLNLLLPICPVLSFAHKIVKLKYVPVSFTGIYAIFMASTAFYIALICYFQLSVSTYTIYKLTQINYENLPYSFPADLIEPPGWLKDLANIYKKTQFSFFTVGVLFTVEYVLLIPQDISILDSSGKINLTLPYGFWSTWIVIFIFIIIGFPIFWILLKTLLLKLCKNTNKKILGELAYFSPSTSADATVIWSYHQLVNHAVQVDKVLFPKGSKYPLIATSLSFFLNLVKLFQLLNLPFFGLPIQN